MKQVTNHKSWRNSNQQINNVRESGWFSHGKFYATNRIKYIHLKITLKKYIFKLTELTNILVRHSMSTLVFTKLKSENSKLKGREREREGTWEWQRKYEREWKRRE